MSSLKKITIRAFDEGNAARSAWLDLSEQMRIKIRSELVKIESFWYDELLACDPIIESDLLFSKDQSPQENYYLVSEDEYRALITISVILHYFSRQGPFNYLIEETEVYLKWFSLRKQGEYLHLVQKRRGMFSQEPITSLVIVPESLNRHCTREPKKEK